ncbi:MAG: hypothetical protein WC859_00015 [Elusimicrobiota bacterium]
MKRRMFIGLLLGLSGLVAGLCPDAFARVLAPASAEEIISALGPDAQGLKISQDKLPDLFTLTASRLEEDPQQFIVEQRYKSGRWKGGKAVIEYARDLSYTRVSVYDKQGNRQRIYSVSAVYQADVRQPVKAASSDETGSPVFESRRIVEKTVGAVSFDEPPPSREVASKSLGQQTKTEKEPETETEVVAQGPSAFVWDDSKGEYVPVKGLREPVSPPSEESKSAPKTERRQKRAEPVAEKAQGVALGASALVWDNVKGEYVSVKGVSESAAKPERRQKRAEPAAEKATDVAPESNAFVWDDAKGEYVQGKGVSEPVSAPSKESKSAPKQEPPRQKRAEPVVEKAPVVAALPTPAVPVPPTAPQRATFPESLAAIAPTEEDIPTTEELLGAPAEQPSENQAQNETLMRKIAFAKKVEKPAKVVVPPVNEPKPAPSAKVPATQESSYTVAPFSSSPAGSGGGSKHTDDGKIDSPPVTGGNDMKEAPAEDAALALAKQKFEKPAKSPVVPELSSPAVGGGGSKHTVDGKMDSPPVTGGNDGKIGPDTSEGDKWVPKEVPKPVVKEPEPPEAASAPKVAMIPSKPVDNSIEALLSKASESKKEVPNEGDAWVPKTAKGEKPDAAIQAELARVRQEKVKKSAPVPPPVRRDINNPEEGVLPVSQFEKVSGPRYGRHREYERRFFVKKRLKAPVKDYDFYVDEVDRKKEIHNVYYYKRDKNVPKLIAVERHENVTFLSNYDVDKEDKGKVITY